MSPIFFYNKNQSLEENYEIFEKRLKEGSIYDLFDSYQFANLRKNIAVIVELYPEVVEKFLEKLEKMREEVEHLTISFDSSFLETFSSFDWEPTRMLLKEGKTEEDDSYQKAKRKADKSKIILKQDEFNKKLKREVLWSIDKLATILKIYLQEKDRKLVDIENYHLDTLYGNLERYPEEIMEILLKATQGNQRDYKMER